MTVSADDSALKPLYVALESMESVFQQGISEYTLITRLQKPPYELLDERAMCDNLLLFQCHFVLFHLLYRLQDAWFAEGKGWLDILATRIQLFPLPDSGGKPAIPDPLRAYYLDWTNFDSTRRDDVDALIAGFWDKIGCSAFSAPGSEDQAKAKEVLEIGVDIVPDRTMVKKQYRRLQHRYHPDKGGDNALAGQLVWAYQILMAAVD